MRNKKLVKKLVLKKNTIANLDGNRMETIKAGIRETFTLTPDCNMVSDHYTACDCPPSELEPCAAPTIREATCNLRLCAPQTAFNCSNKYQICFEQPIA